MNGQYGNGAHVKLERYVRAHPDAVLTVEQVVAITGVSRRAAANAIHTLKAEGLVEYVMVVRRPARGRA